MKVKELAYEITSFLENDWRKKMKENSKEKDARKMETIKKIAKLKTKKESYYKSITNHSNKHDSFFSNKTNDKTFIYKGKS